MDIPALTQIVTQARSGDRRAFAQLVDAYWRPAFGIAFQQLGNAADAEDIVQDSFLKAFQHLPDLEQGDRFVPWLFSIVRRQAQLSWRKDGSRQRVVTRLQEKPERTDNQGTEPEGLRQAIKDLPEEMQALIALHYDGGKTADEIAAALGCESHQVEYRLKLARDKLRILLTKNH